MNRIYDIHIHTNVSPCSQNRPETIVNRALAADLDGIAITDHDTTEGGRLVADIAPPELEVIVGAEITTSQGHLLALDIDKAPPVNTDPVTAIEFVHEQNGVAILAHPFDKFRQVYTTELNRIAEVVDAVETKNSRCVLSRFNNRAQAFARAHNLPMTGGSDAHFPIEVGRAVTQCDGLLLDAIRGHDTIAMGSDQYISGHILTKLNDFAAAITNL